MKFCAHKMLLIGQGIDYTVIAMTDVESGVTRHIALPASNCKLALLDDCENFVKDME